MVMCRLAKKKGIVIYWLFAVYKKLGVKGGLVVGWILCILKDNYETPLCLFHFLDAKNKHYHPEIWNHLNGLLLVADDPYFQI